MADDVDRASKLSEMMLNISLSKAVKFEGVSLLECEECGVEIPQKRRETLVGVKTCIECQRLIEKNNQQYR